MQHLPWPRRPPPRRAPSLPVRLLGLSLAVAAMAVPGALTGQEDAAERPAPGRAHERAGGVGGVGAGGGGADGMASRVLATGERYLGVRYLYGGTSPERGFDCSGFVQHVFARNGVRLPRTSRDQARSGEAVSPTPGTLRAGDLLFFSSRPGVITHVGIYAGDGRILHANSGRGVISYDPVTRPGGRWHLDRVVAARRVIPW